MISLLRRPDPDERVAAPKHGVECAQRPRTEHLLDDRVRSTRSFGDRPPGCTIMQSLGAVAERLHRPDRKPGDHHGA